MWMISEKAMQLPTNSLPGTGTRIKIVEPYIRNLPSEISEHGAD
jgi:hypothetical protein